jgi:hypothetical protein
MGRSVLRRYKLAVSFRKRKVAIDGVEHGYGSVVDGARDVDDDLRRFFGAVFFVGGGEGADELAGQVPQDDGATGGDAVLREEDDECFEKTVQTVEGVEIAWIAGEFSGEVVGLKIFGEVGVTRAEAGIGEGGEKAATGAIGEAVLAARCFVDFDRLSCLFVHFDPR